MRERTFPSIKACKTRRQGFTLIEIMIALVIFVFGALAIVRIFPSGLGIVRDTEDRAIATRISRTTLGGQESKANLSFEAVYKTDPLTGNWLEPISSGTVLTYVGGINSGSIPQGPQDNILATALGDLKHIRGERQRVKAAVIPPNNTGPNPPLTPYALVRFPYSGSVDVYREDTINGVKVDNTGALDFSHATRSDGSPFNDGASGFPNRPPSGFRHAFAATKTVGDTTFYVSYKWLAAISTPATNPRVQGVAEENLQLPYDANPPGTVAWNAAVDGHVLQANVIPGQVAVRFRQFIGSVSPIAPPTPTPASIYSNVGLVRLSNLAVSPNEPLLFDYDVFDWGVLVHDEAVSIPSPAASAAPTPAPLLKRWDVSIPMRGIDAEAGVTALFVRPPSTVAPFTPTTIDWVQKGATTSQSGASSIFDISSSAGRFTYDTSNYTPTRTLYRTLDNWAHQVGVAARAYESFDPAGRPPRSPREGWREYVWLPGGANGGKLYFQPSEAGKVVMVTYEYLDGASVPHLISNAPVPISEELEDATAAPLNTFASLTKKVAVAQLSDLQSNPLGANLSAVRSVQGVSTMARTAWIKGQRYSQVIAKGMRPLVQ